MNLKNLVLKSLGWSFGAKGVGQVVNWCITLYVIRLLAPEDYGLMAICMSFMAILLPLSHFGLGSALVQQKELDDHLLAKSFGFVLFASILLVTGLYLLSPLIARLFEAPNLSLVLQVLSLSIVLGSFGFIPRVILQRSLDFKILSMVEMISGVFGAFLALSLASQGFGVWALVGSHITHTFISSGSLVVITRFKQLPSFDMRGLGNVISYGIWVTLVRFTTVIRLQADVFIIGKLLGERLLGFYSVGKQISALPLDKVQGILNTVAFPAYSKAKTTGDNPSYYLKKYIKLSSFIAFPIFAGISCVAPEFIIVILGEKWEAVIFPVQLMALAMPFRALQNSIAPYLHALGHVKRSFENTVFSLIIMVFLLSIGASKGLTEAIGGWGLAVLLIFFVVFYRTKDVTGIELRWLFKAVGKVALSASIMYCSTFLLGQVLAEYFDLLVLLFIKVSFGAAIYSCCTWVLCRSEIEEGLSLLEYFRKPF